MPIPEAKMQSTGQGGPEVNRDLEVLFSRLNDLVREVNSLRSTQNALTGGSGGSPPPAGNDGGGSGGGSTPQGIIPVYESSRTTLAGTGEGTSTEDAWTTLSSGAPNGARYALIQFYADGNGDTDQGTVKWRTDSSAQAITALELAQDYQTKWGSPHLVTLTASGQFDYRTDTTLGAFTWKIYRVGYAM